MGVLRIAAVIFLFLAAAASAANPKQVIEGCRESVGRPIVMACMKAGGGSLEACREKAKPKVQACVQAAMEKSLSNQAGAKTDAIPTEADIARAAPTTSAAASSSSRSRPCASRIRPPAASALAAASGNR